MLGHLWRLLGMNPFDRGDDASIGLHQRSKKLVFGDIHAQHGWLSCGKFSDLFPVDLLDIDGSVSTLLHGDHVVSLFDPQTAVQFIPEYLVPELLRKRQIPVHAPTRSGGGERR
jgi:hypothetical protein